MVADPNYPLETYRRIALDGDVQSDLDQYKGEFDDMAAKIHDVPTYSEGSATFALAELKAATYAELCGDEIDISLPSTYWGARASAEEDSEDLVAARQAISDGFTAGWRMLADALGDPEDGEATTEERSSIYRQLLMLKLVADATLDVGPTEGPWEPRPVTPSEVLPRTSPKFEIFARISRAFEVFRQTITDVMPGGKPKQPTFDRLYEIQRACERLFIAVP